MENLGKKSEIGAMVTDELYLKFNKIDQYKTRLVDLTEKIKIKITEKDKTIEVANAPKCFISYCWQNSHEAVSKGTMLKNDSLSLGKYDPRSIKRHLEKAGYSSWLDIEQVGKGTLFKDIVDGIRNCKVVIACVSNEYAESENCMKEYRFSANLKKPIIICIFGSSKSYTYWRNTELGLVSCLNNKEINFQIENPEAFNDLISELKNLNIETDTNILTDTNKTLAVENIDEVLSDREVQFSELSELIQRKFLRQIAGFTDSISKPFPRLFVLDIDTASLSITQKSEISTSTDTRALTKTKSIDLQNNNFCVKALCEHEYGWHPCEPSISYDLDAQIFDSHAAYFLRIMTLVKHSKMLDLDILHNEDILDGYLIKAEEKIENQSSVNAIPTRSKPSSMPVLTDLRESFNSITNYVQREIMQFDKKDDNENESNPNNIKYFDLCRCNLPSGKILWLCPEHRKDPNIQILTTDYGANQMVLINDEFNSILFKKIGLNNTDRKNTN